MRRWNLIVACIFLTVICPALSRARATLPTIAHQVATTDDLTILQQLLEAANPQIRAWLDNPDNEFTLFAPTDTAWQLFFDQVGITAEEFSQRTARLDELLRGFLIPMALLPPPDTQGFFGCSDLGTMLPDNRLYVEWQKETSNFRINNEDIASAPLPAANGLIYRVAHLLPEMTILATSGDHTPPDVATSTPVPEPPRVLIRVDTDVRTTLTSDGRFTFLLRLLSEYPHYQDILNTDGLYMVFAPTDTAFEQFFAETGLTSTMFERDSGATFLSYNILPGYFIPDTFFKDYTFVDAHYCSFRRGRLLR